eukprot:755656-Hanusia_phi.AAC.2
MDYDVMLVVLHCLRSCLAPQLVIFLNLITGTESFAFKAALCSIAMVAFLMNTIFMKLSQVSAYCDCHVLFTDH